MRKMECAEIRRIMIWCRAGTFDIGRFEFTKPVLGVPDYLGTLLTGVHCYLSMIT